MGPHVRIAELINKSESQNRINTIATMGFKIIFSNSEKFAEFEWYTAPERRGAM